MFLQFRGYTGLYLKSKNECQNVSLSAVERGLSPTESAKAHWPSNQWMAQWSFKMKNWIEEIDFGENEPFLFSPCVNWPRTGLVSQRWGENMT